mmetsp:Transcript_3120/g.7363  ORF Transcript_3120/g.7363 Transcript_3120/m.7363 type:complete len:216 (+) Transcript_3120:1243-1890(+)
MTDFALAQLGTNRAAVPCAWIGGRFESSTPIVGSAIQGDEAAIRRIINSRRCSYVETSATCKDAASQEAKRHHQKVLIRKHEHGTVNSSLVPQKESQGVGTNRHDKSMQMNHSRSDNAARVYRCEEEHCFEFTPYRCLPYGRHACIFVGTCQRAHLYGAALTHTAHSILRAVCEIYFSNHSWLSSSFAPTNRWSETPSLTPNWCQVRGPDRLDRA